MEDNSALTRALEVAQEQLAEAERELASMRERVRNLRSVVYSLKSLLTPGDTQSDDLHVLLRHAATGQTKRASPWLQVQPEAPSTPTNRRRSGQPSLERAVQVLADAGRPMQMPEIREEWARRGWVNDHWKAPDSAINMIYQRALQAGLVGRMSDRSWVLPVAVQDQLSLEEEAPEQNQA